MKNINTDHKDHEKSAEIVYDHVDALTKLTDTGVLEKFPSEKRFQSVLDRKDTCCYDVATFKEAYINRYRNHWKGVSILKDGYQMTLIQNILFEVKPRTIFEFGAYKGSSAVFMADYMDLISKEYKIISFDYDLKQLHPDCQKDQRIQFVQADLYNEKEALNEELMSLPHPWVVVEDCHVNSYNITNRLSKYMQVGDYYIIEDLSPHCIAEYVDLMDPNARNYKEWGLAKRKEVFEWFVENPDVFQVDTYYADYLGYNGTTNWDGFLRKMK